MLNVVYHPHRRQEQLGEGVLVGFVTSHDNIFLGTAFATLITYAARAVGIPARQAGTPCWNSGVFAGLATKNPNVSQCWAGGNSSYTGGVFLTHHHWVEYWNDATNQWVWVNVPPQNDQPNGGLCQR